MNAHLLLFDEIKQQVQRPLIHRNINLVRCCHEPSSLASVTHSHPEAQSQRTVILRLSDEDSRRTSASAATEVYHTLRSFASLRMTTESMAAPRLRAATQLHSTLQIRGTTAGNLLALLLPSEDCFANADHCFLRVRARRFRAGI